MTRILIVGTGEFIGDVDVHIYRSAPDKGEK